MRGGVTMMRTASSSSSSSSSRASSSSSRASSSRASRGRLEGITTRVKRARTTSERVVVVRANALGDGGGAPNRRAAPELTPEVLKEEEARERKVFVNEVGLMFASGAILGPLLDHQHSRFDVLHYEHPLVLHFDYVLKPLMDSPLGNFFSWLTPNALKGLLEVTFVNETGALETGWWVPPLFGVAAIIIGLGHTTLDGVRLRAYVKTAREAELKRGSGQTVGKTADLIDACPGKPALGWQPGWVNVNACISLFALQYMASGVLASPASPLVNLIPYHTTDVVLFSWGLVTWYVFDNTAQGLFMASLTAFAGPCAEIFLINFGHLYEYSHADFLSIPSWIPWVYFCGAPAVGNLSRQVRNELRTMNDLPGPTTRVTAYARRKWRPLSATSPVERPPALTNVAYMALDRDKRVINKDLKEIPKGRFTVLPNGPLDIRELARKRREEEALLSAIADSRGGTQKRRRQLKKWVNRQNDIKYGRKSVRERILKLLVKTKNDNEVVEPSLDPNDPKYRSRRLAEIQAEIERVESTISEIERLKSLKIKLQKVQSDVDAAAPPLLPKLQRIQSKFDEAVPVPFKPTWTRIEQALGTAVLPIVRENPTVRRVVNGSYESEAQRVQALKQIQKQVELIQNEMQDVAILSAPSEAKQKNKPSRAVK